MPQLYSRMDDTGWLTPSIADVLDQGATPPGGDGSIRQYMLQIQEELAEIGTPARIVNVRSTPSYTLYIARPDVVGRLGSRRTVTTNEIRKSLGRIAEQHKDWTVGYLSQLQEDSEAIGILLRTDQHQPISLRRLVVRNTFRDYPSSLALPLGITLEQQLIIHDLASIGHVIIVGSEPIKQDFVRSLILTLSLLNTPAELRLAFAGQSSDPYKMFIHAPHALGRLLVTAADGQRLLDGLSKEIQRRQQRFADESFDHINDLNEKLKNQSKPLLPRIVLVIDSLSDPTWQEARDAWAEPIQEIIQNGTKTGIYLIASASKEDDIPDDLRGNLKTRVLMRSVASASLGDRLKNLHGSLLRFIDAFVVDDDAEKEPIPVEVCTITDDEIQRTVEYWKQASVQQKQDSMGVSSGKTGLTGILKAPSDTSEQAELPTPPVPEKPTSTALVRATHALSSEDRKQRLEQAQALAAYLGWLGVGPLHDVLSLSVGEAQTILTKLQEMGVLENTEGPTPRFLRTVSDTSESDS